MNTTYCRNRHTTLNQIDRCRNNHGVSPVVLPYGDDTRPLCGNRHTTVNQIDRCGNNHGVSPVVLPYGVGTHA